MLRLAALLALSIATQHVHAGVVSRDLFEPGDGLLTYDDLNQREWLDFAAIQTIPTDMIVDPAERGKLFASFTPATLGDIWNLIAPGSGNNFDRIDINPRQRTGLDWINLLGLVGEIQTENGALRYTGGMLTYLADDGLIGSTAVLFVEQPAYAPNSHSYDIAIRVIPALNMSPPLAYESAYWLYRDATPVPEPTTAYLALTACLAALRLRALA